MNTTITNLFNTAKAVGSKVMAEVPGHVRTAKAALAVAETHLQELNNRIDTKKYIAKAVVTSEHLGQAVHTMVKNTPRYAEEAKKATSNYLSDLKSEIEKERNRTK